jgi:hypothetical protein
MSVEDEKFAANNGTRPDISAQAGDEGYRKLSLGALVALITVGLGFELNWLHKAKSLADAIKEAQAWLPNAADPGVFGYSLIVGPFLALLMLVVGLLVRHGLPQVWQSARRSALLGLLLGGSLLAAAFLGSGKLDVLTKREWVYFVSVVPPLLLGYQALVVWRQRPRSLGAFHPGVPPAVYEALVNADLYRRFERTYEQLLRVFGGAAQSSASDSARGASKLERGASASKSSPASVEGGAYAPAYFVTNFGVPSLLLLIIGFGAIASALSVRPWMGLLSTADCHTLAADPSCGLATALLVQRGLRWGVAGAFVYVLMQFGGRFFRNDLTIGAATWAIVTLIVGPTLAVVLSVAWKMDAGTSPWQTGIVLFFAGLAPRRIVTIIEAVALQFLKAPNETTVPSKLMPIASLRGITPEITTRLREENIGDVSALAYADAIRLVQNLPYDLRQIVDWVDQAQLALTLPKHYEALCNRGISGAIDLAWRWLWASVKTTDGRSSLEPPEQPPPAFRALVDTDADAITVYAVAAQLFYEEQVCLLWVMYNSFSTTAGGVDLSSERSAQFVRQTEQGAAQVS